jgi:hypothetical protein
MLEMWDYQVKDRGAAHTHIVPVVVKRRLLVIDCVDAEARQRYSPYNRTEYIARSNAGSRSGKAAIELFRVLSTGDQVLLRSRL